MPPVIGNSYLEARKNNNGRKVYSAQIGWETGAVMSCYYTDRSEARFWVLEQAFKRGYTIPKWWQFWRKNITDVRKWYEYYMFIKKEHIQLSYITEEEKKVLDKELAQTEPIKVEICEDCYYPKLKKYIRAHAPELWDKWVAEGLKNNKLRGVENGNNVSNNKR